MLTFLSLFLGLVYDTHPVHVAVTGPIVTAEVRLDGETVGRIEGEPWKISCDFGDRLVPHELVAIGRDEKGREVARDRQWVNLPRSRAEAVLTLEEAQPGQPRHARLAWKSLGDLPPSSVQVFLDDELIEVADPARFPLPEAHPNQVHMLSAVLEFEGGLRTRAERLYGGTFADTVATEMTAVPLRRTRGKRTLDAERLAGLLVKNGEPLKVVATEPGLAEIIVVQEPSAQLVLGTIGLKLDRVGTLQRSRAVRLEGGERLRVISTESAQLATGEVPYDLFPISEGFGNDQGTLAYLLTHLMIRGGTDTSRTADAVAVAGVHASSANQPRAVVLILGEEEVTDASRFSVEQVQSYLESLRVPLIVWATGRAESKRVSEDRRPLARKTVWGKARDISSDSRLLAAIGELRRELDSQWIAWVEGSHLPQEIQVAEAAKGFELAR